MNATPSPLTAASIHKSWKSFICRDTDSPGYSGKWLVPELRALAEEFPRVILPVFVRNALSVTFSPAVPNSPPENTRTGVPETETVFCPVLKDAVLVNLDMGVGRAFARPVDWREG